MSNLYNLTVKDLAIGGCYLIENSEPRYTYKVMAKGYLGGTPHISLKHLYSGDEVWYSVTYLHAFSYAHIPDELVYFLEMS